MTYSKSTGYQKNIRRKAMVQRIMVLCSICGVVAFLIGGVSGYALKTHITAKQEEKTETQGNVQVGTEPLVFGAYDDRIFTEEISLDWDADELEFTPLDCNMPEEQQEFLYYLCEGYNLDFTLVMGMIQQESSFRPGVISGGNDYGLMQINSMNHEWLTETLGVTDFTDPYENMRAGCFILRKLFEKYQEPELVLMAYNMGETGAGRLWENGVFSTNYTQKVLNYQHQFNEQLEGDAE